VTIDYLHGSSGNNDQRGGRWWVTKVVERSSSLARDRALQKLGGNVVDFVFKTFVSIITSLGYVGPNLVDNPLSTKLCPLTVTPLTRFPLNPGLFYLTVLVQKLGGNVVDFVFKTFVSIITSLGYVGNKPC
jgi:hypothetical protein